MTGRTVAARGIVPGRASGHALVSAKAFSFLGDVDIRTGRVVNAESPIQGRSVKDMVLIVPDTVGSAGSWRFLYQLFVHHTAPVAIVSQHLPDSSLVQGAILAKVPVLCEPDTDILAAVPDGAVVRVDGEGGLIHIDESEAT
jgi:predicted aconitase with swiveling domain